MDPSVVLNLVDDPRVPELAAEVRARLDRVASALQNERGFASNRRVVIAALAS